MKEKEATPSQEKKDYKNTLCLPQTSFPMKANLVQKEPEMLSFWEKNTIYAKMIEKNKGNTAYILHDGPPYANGNIHLGTALNKILKDIIIKSRTLQGYYAPYIPGWDCHGLPIELQVEQSLQAKNKTDIPPVTLRKICREHATKYINIQKKEFQRLGVFADWETIYTTMQPHYEASIIELTARLVEKGSIIQSKKPIYWCCSCKTALAEAEVEYHNHTSRSIYVAFPIKEFPYPLGVDSYAVIWTTTPWTIPSNQAIALHKKFRYVILEYNGKGYLIAHERLDAFISEIGIETYTILWEGDGSELEGVVAEHPLYHRPAPLLFADYVTLDTGSGLVHTAPGHGREDFETGIKYNLAIYSPIDDSGNYTEDVRYFAGTSITEGNELVIEKLQEVGALLHSSRLTHSYPHCWRCRKPVIFRATKQWFISLEHNDLRKKALNDISHNITWIPSWGKNRIHAMVEARPDWCISRQRTWGVPIIALHCKACGTTYNDPSFIHNVAKAAKEHPTGSDIWYERTAEELHAQFCPEYTCSCGSQQFTKESDILDVWFDSASSFFAVLQNKDYALAYPATTYLEGSDQHRGWFHSSLLVSEGVFDCPPYTSVITHGYVVDGKGYKMSKSIGNVIAPHEIISKYGAEIIRLWVSSVEYKEDIRISDEIIARLLESYRRIRNTCRYMLGNLYDFSEKNMLAFEELDDFDRYALSTMYEAHSKIQEAYKNYEFHKCYQIIYATSITELSALYFDIIKERLYLSAKESHDRYSAQTALYLILQMFTLDIAPILSFTAEEVWQNLQQSLQLEKAESIFLTDANSFVPYTLSEKEKNIWEQLLLARSLLTKALEPMRAEGSIGHSFDVDIILYIDNADDIRKMNTVLRVFFIVSSVTIQSYEEKGSDAIDSDSRIAFVITPAQGEKCERCWVYSTQCGSHQEHPTLCPRCTEVVLG